MMGRTKTNPGGRRLTSIRLTHQNDRLLTRAKRRREDSNKADVALRASKGAIINEALEDWFKRNGIK
jgi:hypothetical protein